MKFPSPSSAEAVIAASGVSRHFGAKAALDDVSMFVPRGSVLGLVGENGAGKTTLIKLFNLWRTVFCMGLLTLAGKAKTDLNLRKGLLHWCPVILIASLAMKIAVSIAAFVFGLRRMAITGRAIGWLVGGATRRKLCCSRFVDAISG